MLGPCFVVHYIVAVLVLHSYRWGRESWFHYSNCILMSFDCKCPVSLPHDAMGCAAVCDCGISWSYSLFHVIQLSSILCIHTVSTTNRILL